MDYIMSYIYDVAAKLSSHRVQDKVGFDYLGAPDRTAEMIQLRRARLLASARGGGEIMERYMPYIAIIIVLIIIGILALIVYNCYQSYYHDGPKPHKHLIYKKGPTALSGYYVMVGENGKGLGAST